EIRVRYPEPGDKEELADQFNAEGSMLDRARAVAHEDIRYEGALAHVDENRRAREEEHERRLKSIEDDNRLPADAKALERAEENGRFEVDLRKFERLRDLVEKAHQNRRAAIDARFGNPNPGADIFTAQGDPTPPEKPGPARADNRPIEGGISGGRQGGKAVAGPTGRPPLKGGSDQTGTGGVGKPETSQPPVLKGSVEENVGLPPQPGAPQQQPCGKEFDDTVISDDRFLIGLSDSFARCFEQDVAMLPVAPAAFLAAKVRWVRVAMNAATYYQTANALLDDLKKQRPNNECAYDVGIWYGQVLCDGRDLAYNPVRHVGREGPPPAPDERLPFPHRTPGAANETPRPTVQAEPPSRQAQPANETADAARQRTDAEAQARAERQRQAERQAQDPRGTDERQRRAPQQENRSPQQREQDAQRAAEQRRAQQQHEQSARREADRRAQEQQQAREERRPADRRVQEQQRQQDRRAAQEQRAEEMRRQADHRRQVDDEQRRQQQRAQVEKVAREPQRDPRAGAESRGRQDPRAREAEMRRQHEAQNRREQAQTPNRDAPLQGGVTKTAPMTTGPSSAETGRAATPPRASNDNAPDNDPLRQILAGYGMPAQGASTGGATRGTEGASGPSTPSGRSPSPAPPGVEMSPYGDLTADELAKLKEAAAESGFPIDVVGSVAKGRRRFGDGPIGKDADQVSDLDILLHPDADLKTGGRASDAVYARFPKGDKVDTIIVGEPRANTPRIRIEPNGTVTAYGDVPIRKN
ncbi:MAG TPA: hypothetical protein VHM01_02380, partial [Alphaproteobacteria bacterium]|nr:hypothetical protein [Alphaproteobacteria bacterium]